MGGNVLITGVGISQQEDARTIDLPCRLVTMLNKRVSLLSFRRTEVDVRALVRHTSLLFSSQA